MIIFKILVFIKKFNLICFKIEIKKSIHLNSLFNLDTNQNINLKPCPNCGRKFTIDRLSIHTNTCGNEKKRKIFDATKMRVKGTEAESFFTKKKAEVKVSVID